MDTHPKTNPDTRLGTSPVTRPMTRVAMTADIEDTATTGIADTAMVTTQGKRNTLMYKGSEGGRGLVIIRAIETLSKSRLILSQDCLPKA